MITDPNKGILGISYNHLNLPTIIGMGKNRSIAYLYDANGVRLRMTTVNNKFTYVRDYFNGIEYYGNTLESIYHLEGRVFNNNWAFRYEYAIADHLGNTRLTITEKNGNGEVDVNNLSTNEIL